MNNNLSDWEKYGPGIIRSMIARLNGYIRSDLSLLAIRYRKENEEIPESLANARKSAQDLNFWLHEYRKFLEKSDQ